MTPILGQSSDPSFQVSGSALTITIVVGSMPVSSAARVRTRARSSAGTGQADADADAAEGDAGGAADADAADPALDDGTTLGPTALLHAARTAHRRKGTRKTGLRRIGAFIDCGCLVGCDRPKVDVEPITVAPARSFDVVVAVRFP
jgi:hypothetical protein